MGNFVDGKNLMRHCDGYIVRRIGEGSKDDGIMRKLAACMMPGLIACCPPESLGDEAFLRQRGSTWHHTGTSFGALGLGFHQGKD